MARTMETRLPDLVRVAAHPLAETAESYDRLMDFVGDAS